MLYRLYDMTIYYRILPDVTKYSYYHHLLSYFILIHFLAWVCVKVQLQKDHGGFGHCSYDFHPGLGATFSHG